MKIRNGFVSNSSSSSFIIAFKGKLSEYTLLKAFGVPNESPLHIVAQEMAKCLLGNCSSPYFDLASYVERCNKDYYAVNRQILDLMQNGYTVMEGTVSDEEGEVEGMICNFLGLNYKSPDLVIFKEAGY